MNLYDIRQIATGSLLVAGTCIGAGMLGLPVVTAVGGLYASLGTFVGIWFVLLLSALLMLEASLWLPQDTNLISMAEDTLGPWGKNIAWGAYLFFLYALLAAYTVGGSALFQQLFEKLGVVCSRPVVTTFYVALFSTVVFIGFKCVDFLNKILMIGLFVAFGVLMVRVLPQVDVSFYTEPSQPLALWQALPLLVAAFGFHLLIPSLRTYLNGNVLHLRGSIIVGSILPFVLYALWEVAILGMIPMQGETGLLAMAQHGDVIPALTQHLDARLQSGTVSIWIRVFTFCALFTSVIGCGLGLFDFLADGCKIKKQGWGRLGLSLLTFIPPLIFAWVYPQGFLMALNYAGIFAAILLIIYPTLMVLSGRTDRKAAYRAPVNRWGMFAIIGFGLAIIVVQILARL